MPTDLKKPYTPWISLDRHSGEPLYQQIAKPLEALINSGQLEPGQLIEDEVSLAKRLDVSRPTVRRAFQDLVTKGLLVRKRGAGTRVTPTQVRRSLSLTSLNEDLIKAGFEPRTKVLSYEVKLANDVEAKMLECPAGAEIIRIKRSRSANERPLAIMENVLPAATAPSLTELSQAGLYKCLEGRGIHPATARQSVGARTATEEDSQWLNIEPGAPLLTMQRTAYDASGKVVESGTHIYNAELYSFHFTLSSE